MGTLFVRIALFGMRVGTFEYLGDRRPFLKGGMQ